jgi:hypothetical protein
MPWPSAYIDATAPSTIQLSGLEATLSTAEDERPLQTFLASSPAILQTLLPSAADAWCFDRPQFGSEFIPDFLLCHRNSLGYNWTLVELESPQMPALIKTGRPSAKLTEALAQIRDWRRWLRENIAYARSTLGFRGIHAEIAAHVLIGRRAHLDTKHIARYQELSLSSGANVLSYDRLLDAPSERLTDP